MKVVFVVDSINEITSKIDMLKARFGNDILYVVKGEFESIFRTYGYQPNAIYSKNLPKVISLLLAAGQIQDVIICYSSLKISHKLLNSFIERIGDKSKVVNILPKYNSFEQMCNSAYNIYVNSLFKVKDSMCSPKLQFLPEIFVVELLESHFSNRLFQIDPEYCLTLETHDKETNDSLKTKTKFNKFQLLPIIAVLLITLGLLATLAFAKFNFIYILIFVVLYVLDILLAIIQQCKILFDKRFIK